MGFLWELRKKMKWKRILNNTLKACDSSIEDITEESVSQLMLYCAHYAKISNQLSEYVAEMNKQRDLVVQCDEMNYDQPDLFILRDMVQNTPEQLKEMVTDSHEVIVQSLSMLEFLENMTLIEEDYNCKKLARVFFLNKKLEQKFIEKYKEDELSVVSEEYFIQYLEVVKRTYRQFKQGLPLVNEDTNLLIDEEGKIMERNWYKDVILLPECESSIIENAKILENSNYIC